MQPEALLRDRKASEGFCEAVRDILLAQPLNPLVKLEFEVIPRAPFSRREQEVQEKAA